MTQVIVTASRSVASHDLLAFNLSRHGYMLTNRESKNVIRLRQRETITSKMVSATRHAEVL